MNNVLFEMLLIKASKDNTPFSTLLDINNLISDSVHENNSKIAEKLFEYTVATKGQESLLDLKEVFLSLRGEVEITSIDNPFFKEFLSKRVHNGH